MRRDRLVDQYDPSTYNSNSARPRPKRPFPSGDARGGRARVCLEEGNFAKVKKVVGVMSERQE